jgi:hypothetical protein
MFKYRSLDQRNASKSSDSTTLQRRVCPGNSSTLDGLFFVSYIQYLRFGDLIFCLTYGLILVLTHDKENTEKDKINTCVVKMKLLLKRVS